MWFVITKPIIIQTNIKWFSHPIYYEQLSGVLFKVDKSVSQNTLLSEHHHSHKISLQEIMTYKWLSANHWYDE